jgi:hypothetical protein
LRKQSGENCFKEHLIRLYLLLKEVAWYASSMARNLLLTAPPYPVDQALRGVGANLRLARLRRGLTIQEVAGRIGTGVRAVADAEKGKPSSGVAVVAALLWAYDLLGPFSLLADPASDSEGEALARGRDPVRARRSKGLDNDF